MLDSKDQKTMADQGELTGWEQIAKYLAVSVRTAQIYERDSSLPVRRLPGARGRVWAYVDELRAWKVGLLKQGGLNKEQLTPKVVAPLSDSQLSEPGPR